MSLVQLKSKTNLNNQGNTFSSYFNRGLVVKPNSQVGLVSATIQTQPQDVVIVTKANNTFSMRMGYNPYVHNTITVEIPVGIYEPAHLREVMNLEISKKQNFLPFKKLTVLNGFEESTAAEVDEWLQYGTDVEFSTTPSLVIDGVTITHTQLPPTNDGNIGLLDQYSARPKLSNFEDYYGQWFREAPPGGTLLPPYNNITYLGGGGVQIQCVKLGPYSKLDADGRGGAPKASAIIPVILKEYVAYGQVPLKFKINRPSSGDWKDIDCFVGLISYGDILDKTSSLIDGQTNRELDVLRPGVPIPAESADYGCKVGVHFRQSDSSSPVGLAVPRALKKDDSDNQFFGTGVVNEKLGTGPYVLNNAEPAYWVAFHPGYGAGGSGVQQNRCRITCSPNLDLSAPLWDVETNPRESFFGTKAYPLIPIVYNSINADVDLDASKIVLEPNIFNDNSFTNGRILDSECFVSYPSDIQYNPERDFEFNLFTDDASKVIPTASTGNGVDTQLLNMDRSIFMYFSDIKDPYQNRFNTFVNVNDLIQGDNSERWAKLHPDTDSTFGGLIGLTEFVYECINAGEYNASPQLVRTDTITNTDVENPSFHLQINNLPIKSLNSDTNAVVPTFAVIPKTVFKIGQATTYAPAQIVWVDLNNKQEISLNELTVRITESNNVLTNDIYGTVELIVMIRER